MGHYTSKLVFKNSGGGSGSGGSGGGGNGSHPKLSKAEKQLFRQLKSLENDVEAQVTDLIVPPLPLYVENRPVAPIAFVSSVAELLEGPDAEEHEASLTKHGINIACGRTISTYPRMADKRRQGDPVCDYFRLSIEHNRQLVVVCDGCGWGNGARKAARDAAAGFHNYMLRHHQEITDIHYASHLVARAVAMAQQAVVDGYSDGIEPGTTTLLGGILFQVQPKPDDAHQWCFVFGGVGDCKGYIYSLATGQFKDLTAGSRAKQESASDCGGRLGGYIENAHPDLRNFGVSAVMCSEGDIIFIVSDGVHDNLSPRHLGKQPSEVGLDPNASWDSLSADVKADAATKHSELLLTQILSTPTLIGSTSTATSTASTSNPSLTSNTAPSSSGAGPGAPPHLTPRFITRQLLRHCISTNQNSFEFMRKHPEKRLPRDYVGFPGKMDHTTCIAMRVGPVDKAPADPEPDEPDDLWSSFTPRAEAAPAAESGEPNTSAPPPAAVEATAATSATTTTTATATTTTTTPDATPTAPATTATALPSSTGAATVAAAAAASEPPVWQPGVNHFK